MTLPRLRRRKTCQDDPEVTLTGVAPMPADTGDCLMLGDSSTARPRLYVVVRKLSAHQIVLQPASWWARFKYWRKSNFFWLCYEVRRIYRSERFTDLLAFLTLAAITTMVCVLRKG